MRKYALHLLQYARLQDIRSYPPSPHICPPKSLLRGSHPTIRVSSVQVQYTSAASPPDFVHAHLDGYIIGPRTEIPFNQTRLQSQPALSDCSWLCW